MRKRLAKSSPKLRRGKTGRKPLPLSKKVSGEKLHKGLSTQSNADNIFPSQFCPVQSSPPRKKFGGVRLAIECVEAEQCVCGNTVEECNAAWDVELGIVSHAAEDYRENLNRVRGAEMAGRDPYHWRGRIGLSLALPVHAE